MISFLDGGLHGSVEQLDIGLFKAFEGLSHPGEDAGKNDAGIAACTEEHALRHGFGHLTQGISAGVGACFNGHVHIVPGVSVRNGEDIEVVDFLAPLGQASGAAADEVQV